MFERLINYLRSSTDNTDGYVAELHDITVQLNGLSGNLTTMENLYNKTEAERQRFKAILVLMQKIIPINYKSMAPMNQLSLITSLKEMIEESLK